LTLPAVTPETSHFEEYRNSATTGIEMRIDEAARSFQFVWNCAWNRCRPSGHVSSSSFDSRIRARK
jgi:hypothetical protein